MTADALQTLRVAEESTSPRKALRLGFNTRVSFNSGPGGAERGLRDGIALFKAAERLGYQSGWAYQRHFDNYLSSPLPFFAAAGQHTERITLGSAVIPMRYQDPILLAEAAGTTDLLIGGRLNLTLSSGRVGFERTFGHDKVDARAEGQRRLARFLSGDRGSDAACGRCLRRSAYRTGHRTEGDAVQRGPARANLVRVGSHRLGRGGRGTAPPADHRDDPRDPRRWGGCWSVPFSAVTRTP